ncbi:hypothetical protein J6590_076939 [Homalodisca vitripennis]|nr:hypothetical protein J6590_076939 [Homalodisca vitripennis]
MVLGEITKRNIPLDELQLIPLNCDNFSAPGLCSGRACLCVDGFRWRNPAVKAIVWVRIPPVTETTFAYSLIGTT